MPFRGTALALLLLVTLAVGSFPGAAEHNGSSARTERACGGGVLSGVTVCVELTIRVGSNCAFLPVGAACSYYAWGVVRGDSALPGQASGTVGSQGASCTWSVADACSAQTLDTVGPTTRGAFVCMPGSADARDTLHSASVSFTHCVEMH